MTDDVNRIKSIIDNYLSAKPLGEPFNSGILAYRILDEFNERAYSNQQYLRLGKWAATREEIAISAMAGEDIESLANRIKLSTELEHWSVHAVANNYWHFKNRADVRRAALVTR